MPARVQGGDRRGVVDLLLAKPAGCAVRCGDVRGVSARSRNRREHTDAEIEAAVRAFQPDAILTSGWADKGYVKICKQMRKHGVPVIAGCDTQWKGSLRQHVASWVAPWHLHKAIKILWVTGERQATLARALGYDGACLWDGYYACDWERFALPLTSAPCSLTPAPPSFLYVGRYVPEKGIEALAEAYQMYQQQVEKPWPLVCAGAGPLKDMLVGVGAGDSRLCATRRFARSNAIRLCLRASKPL